MRSSNTAPSGLVFCVAVVSAFSFLATNVAAQLPDSPGTITQLAQAAAPQNTPQQPDTTQSDTKQANTQQSTASPNQQSSGNQQQEAAPSGQKPVGTAAAESVPTSGVAASQPAGTAIAPGKQRRTRSILIKVGALVGAGIAVGTVAALTLGTSSKPPGAR
jgi:cytoskeletal protein RodZ